MKNNGIGISHFTWIITEDCNCRCKYCFIDKNPKKSNIKVGKAMIDWMFNSEISKDDKNLQLTFFGGEPLTEFDLLKKIVIYGMEKSKKTGKNISYSITTNGTLLSGEKLDWILNNDIGILFSIDGKKEFHNRYRVFADGKGSYDRTMEDLDKLLQAKPQVVARMTYVPDTIPYLFENYKFLLEDLHFQSCAPTFATDPHMKLNEDEIKELNKQFKLIEDYEINRAKQGKKVAFNYIHKCIRQILTNKKLPSPCGAGKKYLAIGTEGGIFPCHRFTQWAEWELGNIFSGYINQELRDKCGKFDCEVNEDCKKCQVLFCGGQCLASNYVNYKDITKHSQSNCAVATRQFRAAKRVYEEIKNDKQFMSQFKKPQKRDFEQSKVTLDELKRILEGQNIILKNIAKVILDLAEDKNKEVEIKGK